MAEKKTIELEITSNLDSAEKSVGNLKSQLRQAQAEVASLSDKFGATSKEAVNAAKKAAELRDRIGDAKSLTDAFNPDAKFRALSGTLSGVAGGFSAITGVMGALGSESKDVEQAILKVQSAMAIASGLQALGESIDQFKILGSVIANTTIGQRALTIATATYTYVNAAATTGLKLLRGAMISTGVGALVVGIGYLISKMGDASEATEKLTKRQESLNKQLENTKKLTDDAAKSIDYNTQIQLAKAKQRGASEKELLRIELDGYEARGKANNKEIQDIQKTQKNQLNLTKEQNKRIQELREENQNLQRQGNLAVLNLDAELAVKKRENRKKEIKEVKDNSNALLEELNTIVDYEEDARLRKEERNKANQDALLKELDDQVNAEEDAANRKIAIEQRVADAKDKIQQASFAVAEGGINLLKGLFEKNKGIQKGLLIAESAIGIAKIIISTQAANAADRLYASTLGPVAGPIYLGTKIPLNKIGAGIGIASNIAATAKGLSALGGGSAPSGGSASGGSSGGGAAPAFNVVGASATNQLAQTIGQKEQQPLKAYVVAGDITTAQSLEKNIIQAASIG